MINKRFEVTIAQLNANTPVELDIELIKTIPAIVNDPDTRYLYPQQIQIINDTECGVEWLSLNSEEEYAEYTITPADFTFVRLPAGFTLEDDFTSFGRCYKLIIKGYQNTAVSNLIVEMINYRKSLR